MIHRLPRRLFACLMATLAVGSLLGPDRDARAAEPNQIRDVVNRVQAFYDKTKSFKSDFRQQFFVKAYNKRKSSEGHVTFQKPGKMSWVYSNPKNNRVVSDGKMLRVYEAQNRQMYEQKVDKSQYPAALSFLTGEGRLAETFKFQLYDGKKMNFPGGLVLVGTPKKPHPAYKTILFYVDAKTYQVRRVMVLDAQGNRNRFDFVNPRINEPVTPSTFKFSPPAGTTLVHP